MKTLTTILVSLAFVAFSTSNAFAQDDDDDLFGGDDDTTTPGDGDGDGTSDGTGDGMDAGGDAGGDAGTADTGAAGGVAKAAGKLGVGFSTTTANLNGVEAEYWLSEKLVISGLGRITLFTGDADATFLQFGAGALFVLKDRGKAALMGGGRFILGYGDVGGASATSIAIEVPLRLQMAMHDSISLHVEGGVALLIGDQAGLGGNPLNDFTFAVGTNNLYGSGGVTFYF